MLQGGLGGLVQDAGRDSIARGHLPAVSHGELLGPARGLHTRDADLGCLEHGRRGHDRGQSGEEVLCVPAADLVYRRQRTDDAVPVAVFVLIVVEEVSEESRSTSDETTDYRP